MNPTGRWWLIARSDWLQTVFEEYDEAKEANDARKFWLEGGISPEMVEISWEGEI